MKRPTILISVFLVIVVVIGGGALIENIFFGEEHDRQFAEEQLRKTWDCDFTYKGKSNSKNENEETEFYFTPSVKPELTVTAYFYEGPHRGTMSVVPPFIDYEKTVTDDFLQKVADEYMLEINGSDALSYDSQADCVDTLYSVCQKSDDFKRTFLKRYENGDEIVYNNSIVLKLSDGETEKSVKFRTSYSKEDIQKAIYVG